ncbi:MAG: DUF2007 domain-containing protein [Planctomycetota bacterium]
MDSDYELIRIASLTTATEAHILRMTLNHAGIPAQVTGEQSSNTLGGGALIPAEVHVRKIDETNARVIVDEYLKKPQKILEPWTCSCGEDIDEGFGSCWSCGRDHPSFSDLNDG